MACFSGMDAAALKSVLEDSKARYEEFKSRGLSLDMTRGKPCSEQLDLSNDLLTCVDGSNFKSENGTDTRNYGGVDGLPEAKKFFADFLEVAPEEVIVGGNSSLTLMYDTVARSMMFAMPGAEKPWGKQDKIKFLCPSPGYDRHFSVCETFGIEMIVVDMQEDGPDMDEVEKLVASDASIKGMWCVPKYANPTGVTYSPEKVARLAQMPTAAPDFRIFWDNAYTVHHLTDKGDELANIMDACKAAGNADRVFIFGSTSKVSFSGAGLAAMAASADNVSWLKKTLTMQTIGPDKVNQLRHVRFFKDMAGVAEHMKKHAAIIKPKFDAVLEILERELADSGVACWTKPNGGYFISLDVPEGCAKAVVAMAAEAGAKLTSAGATFPYGKDPLDRNIRIAPTLPGLDEIKTATELLCLCVKIASCEKLLAK